MAYILWPRSNEIQRDDNDVRAGAARAFIYEADTTSTLATYTTSALTVAHGEVITADAYGRFPAVYIPTGTNYRERVVTSDSVLLWDTDNIPNPDPAEDPDPVDEDQLLQTGDFVPSTKTGARSGFVRANARTMGSGDSAGTERANDDTEDLFIHLWTVATDTVCPVSGGRGATAALDWAANKTITLPNARSAALIGVDAMGNSAAGLMASVPYALGTDGDMAAIAGVNLHTLTGAQLPATTPAGTISQITPAGTNAQVTGTISQITPAGTISTPVITVINGGSLTEASAGSKWAGGGTEGVNISVTATSSTPTFTGTPVTPTFTGSTPTFTGTPVTPTFTGTPFGSGTAHNNTQRSVACTIYIKL